MEEDPDVEGAVSLWVGVAPSRDALEKYVDIDYSTGDPSRLSQLADDFGTGFYDEDFVDTSFHSKPTRSLPELLRGCSYAAQIIPKFVTLCGELMSREMNSAVVLYDFRHRGNPGLATVTVGSVRLQYVGSIDVEMPWPDE
jgi:hypothetical protein